MIHNHPLFILGGAPQAHVELRGYPHANYREDTATRLSVGLLI
jgi:hypothetical protein